MVILDDIAASYALPAPASWWAVAIVLGVLAILVGGLTVAVLRVVARSLRLPITTGGEGLVGAASRPPGWRRRERSA
jgi:hypothetical protein